MKAWLQKNPVATLVIIALACTVAVLYGSLQSARQQLSTERACEKSPICLDGRARWESLTESYPLQSRTGRWFFQGTACTSDCAAMVAGYRHAESLGATKASSCANLGQEASQGCMAYVGEPEPSPAPEDYGAEPH